MPIIHYPFVPNNDPNSIVSNQCTKCHTEFSSLHIVTRRKRVANSIYCEKCWNEKDSDWKLKLEDVEKRNKRLKLMLDVIPKHILPGNILDDYKAQKPMDYEFICSDGTIHVSELALQYSDFYTDMCKGMIFLMFLTQVLY